MSRRRPALRLLAAAAAAALLSGCISVLPKEKPVQMYRFGVGQAPAASPAAPAPGPKIGLVLARVELPRAAAGDRILAITGEQAAYLAGARWVSPAAVLFEDSVDRAFDSRSQTVRILNRGETGASQGALRVEASDFEARYPAAGASPVVKVTLQAMLLRRNGSFVADHTVSAEAPASENGVRAIVAAYDQAVDQANAALVAWADANAAQVLTPDPALPRPATAVTATTSTTRSR